MNKILAILISSTFIACSTSESMIFLDCVNQQREVFKVYEGEVIQCQSHYWLTTFDNQNYIDLDNHCADLTRPFVVNEQCEDICEEDPHNPDSECGKYLKGKQQIEILLIEK